MRTVRGWKQAVTSARGVGEGNRGVRAHQMQGMQCKEPSEGQGARGGPGGRGASGGGLSPSGVKVFFADAY